MVIWDLWLFVTFRTCSVWHRWRPSWRLHGRKRTRRVGTGVWMVCDALCRCPRCGRSGERFNGGKRWSLGWGQSTDWNDHGGRLSKEWRLKWSSFLSCWKKKKRKKPLRWHKKVSWKEYCGLIIFKFWNLNLITCSWRILAKLYN